MAVLLLLVVSLNDLEFQVLTLLLPWPEAEEPLVDAPCARLTVDPSDPLDGMSDWRDVKRDDKLLCFTPLATSWLIEGPQSARMAKGPSIIDR